MAWICLPHICHSNFSYYMGTELKTNGKYLLKYLNQVFRPPTVFLNLPQTIFLIITLQRNIH